jgi:diguanylate cyclase (GGDEF)-like protein
MDQPLASGIATEALAIAPIGVLILDKTGHITWLNHALEKLLAIDSNSLVGKNETSVDPYWRSLLFNPEPVLLLEAASARPDRWLQTWRSRLNVSGGFLHYYADITDLQNTREDRARLSEELAQHVTRDQVTGLPNRQALLQGLEPLVSRSRRYHNPLSVIRLRIDNLPDIEAECGMGNSDIALTAVAQMLKDQMRWADLIGRFDKDEFLLVLPETTLDAATQLLDKLRLRLAGLTPGSRAGRPISLVSQFGVAGWIPGDDRAKLLRRAREMLEQESSRSGNG